jgi:hypothetical protein
MSKFTDTQKDILLHFASLDPVRFDVLAREDSKDEHKPYHDELVGRLGITWQELRALMPVWRKAYINAVFDAKKRADADSGVTSQEVVPWQQKFRTLSQLESGPMQMLIEGFMPWGITGIGSLSGVAKTWFGLSLSKALTLGKPFLGVYPVAQRHNVLYLIPEMGDRSFRNRAERLGLPMDETHAPYFRCTTVRDGRIMLTDSSLQACIKETKPVVFLDTLVRFNAANDENSAQQNTKLMANVLFDFQTWGAPGVIFMHHSPKYSADAESMNLENAFRGTGDLGAMCDAAYGLATDKRKKDNKEWDAEYFDESKRLTRVLVKCVKPRDFEGPEAFLIQGRPYIDERGDFAVVDGVERRSVEERMIEEIRKNVGVTVGALRKQFSMRDSRIKRIAEQAGFLWDGKYWQSVKPEVPSDSERVRF